MTRSGKRTFNFEICRYSNPSFSKTTALNSSINVWIDFDIVLNASEVEQALIASFRMEFI